MAFFIIIRGPLGSGKSTISEELAKRLKGKHISVDRILDEFNLTKDKEAGYISQKSFIKANAIAADRAKEFLDKKMPVIFDGNFYWKSQIDDLIDRLKCKHFVFTLKAPLEVCIERDRKRNKTHGKDAALAVYRKSTEFSYGIEIDVAKKLNEVIEEIISHISKE